MNYRDKLNQYTRVKEPDKDMLSELTIRAKGPKRSLRQFAEELEVSPSTLSRIVNKKTASANSDLLIADIAEHADPESGVTFEKMMEAHGMAPRDETKGAITLFRETATATLLKELLRRDYKVNDIVGIEKPTHLDSILGRCYLDLELHTDALGKDDSVWMFSFFVQKGSDPVSPDWLNRIRQWMLMYAGMMCFNEENVDRVSVVISEESTFDAVIPFFEGYVSSFEISLILIDLENRSITKEYVIKDDPYAEPVFFPVEDDDFIGTEIDDFENAIVFGDEFIFQMKPDSD
jgi:transcriptional regulator with XRE-family HTH domain